MLVGGAVWEFLEHCIKLPVGFLDVSGFESHLFLLRWNHTMTI